MRIKNRFPGVSGLFRKKLNVYTKTEALNVARRYKVMFDELMSIEYPTKEAYLSAIKLLKEYDEACNNGWASVDSFLASLSSDEGCEWQESTLEQAIHLRNSVSLKDQRNEEEIIELKEQVSKLIQSLSNTPPASQEYKACDDKPLDTLVNEFIREKENSVRKSSSTSYSTKITKVLRIIIELHDGCIPTTSQLSDDLFRQLKKVIQNYPDITRQPAKGMSENDRVMHALEYNREELENMGIKVLSTSSISKHLEIIREFLRFIYDGKYIISDFTGIMKYNSKVPKGNKSRNVYAPTELKAIFESSKYKHGDFKKPHQYWAPLIALFTGARASEILQLHTSDIYEEGGVFLIDFNDYAPDKHLKANMAKKVPIHSCNPPKKPKQF